MIKLLGTFLSRGLGSQENFCFEIAPAEATVTGLDLNTVEHWSVVENAPAGVDGSALKAEKTALYAGGAISFGAYTGELVEGYSLSFRVYAAADAGAFEMWFYKTGHTGHGGNDGWHVHRGNLGTNQWVDITMSLSDVMNLVDANGNFTGFQFGFFTALNAFYIDSLSIVTVVDVPDIPLFA